MKKILVIIPAFNEAGNVGNTVDEVARNPIACDILVVDDGSTDATAHEARAHGAIVLSLPFNLGIGGAVQTGFKYALAHGYDVAVQLDGDGQHDAGYLDRLVAPIVSQQADMVIGSRFLEETGGFKSSFGRRIGINFFVNLINVLTGIKITDPTSGFRAHGKRVIASFAKYYPHDFPEPEAVVVAKRASFNILEIPVLMRARQRGSSSIGNLASIYYMLKVTVAILLNMIRRPESGVES